MSLRDLSGTKTLDLQKVFVSKTGTWWSIDPVQASCCITEHNMEFYSVNHCLAACQTLNAPFSASCR